MYYDNTCPTNQGCTFNPYSEGEKYGSCKYTNLPSEKSSCGKLDPNNECWKYQGCFSDYSEWTNPTCVEEDKAPCDAQYDKGQCDTKAECVYDDYMCKTKLQEGETCKEQTEQDCWKYSECIQHNYECYNKYEAPCDAFYDETNCPVDKCSWNEEQYACYKTGEEISCNKYYDKAKCPTDRCAWDKDTSQCYPKEGKTCDMYNDNTCPTDKCDFLATGTYAGTEYGRCVDKGNEINMECNNYYQKDYCPADDCKFITTDIYDDTESGVCVGKDKEVGCSIYYNKDYCPIEKCEWRDEMCKGQVETTTTMPMKTTTTMPMKTSTTQFPVESVEDIVEDMKPAENAPLQEKQEYIKMTQNLEKLKRTVKPENVKVVAEKMRTFIPNQKQEVVKTLSTLDETQATNLNTTLPQLDTTNQKELMKVFAIPDYKQQVLTVFKNPNITPVERKQQIVKILEKSSKNPTIQRMFVTTLVTVPVNMPHDPTHKYTQPPSSWSNNNKTNERTMTGRQASNYNTRNGIVSQTPSNVNKGVSVSNYEGVLNVFYPYMM